MRGNKIADPSGALIEVMGGVAAEQQVPGRFAAGPRKDVPEHALDAFGIMNAGREGIVDLADVDQGDGQPPFFIRVGERLEKGEETVDADGDVIGVDKRVPLRSNGIEAHGIWFEPVVGRLGKIGMHRGQAVLKYQRIRRLRVG